jgi:predicted RNase H-like HicB family nuclease
MSRYLTLRKKLHRGYSPYSPDLPGCVAAGSTRSEFAREMDNAIEFYLEGLRAAPANRYPSLDLKPHTSVSQCKERRVLVNF